MEATEIKVDNQSAIAIAKNPVFHGKTKHFKIKYHFVREAELAKEICLVHCCSRDQLADVLSKPLASGRFECLRKEIGVCYLVAKEECSKVATTAATCMLPCNHARACKFVAHIGCALTKLGGKGTSIGKLMEQDERNVESEIEYFDHEHPLCFKKVIEQNESAICKACFLEILDKAYACKSCKYYIHKTCTNFPWEVLHPLHPQHSLKLLSEVRGKIFPCEGCRDCTEGFVYVCSMCDFMLDVKCALLRVPKIETQRLKEMEERRPKSCLFNKTHQLSFFNIKAVLDECCSFCRRYLKGPIYACSDCEYLLHESCLGFPREMKLQFHPLHPFHSLLDDSGKICYVCKRDTWYDICNSCVQCDLHLHASCANSLKRVLRSTSHIHNLYYFGPNIKAEGDKYEMQKCGKCRRRLRSSPLSFCMECDTKLHIVECALPPSLKSKYHLHPCTHKPGFMEDDSGQNYCDICEEERDPEDHIYYCTECQGHFVAHINCMLNSEEEIAAEGSSNMALDFPSTSAWAERERVSTDESEEDDQSNSEDYSEEDDQSNNEAYACKSCEYYKHKTCTNLPWEVPKIETQRLKEMEERRPSSCLFNKAHQLSFFNIKAVLDECCSFCQRDVKGPTYSCSDCGFLLHESCLGFPSEMKLQFHPLHPFHSLLDNITKICHVCKREIWYGICYSCVQCDLHLHASCAKSLKRVLNSTSHIHDLYYFGPNIMAEGFRFKKQKCGKCRKMFPTNPLRFCIECDTKLNFEYALPPSLKSKYHLHPCTLKPGFMEDDNKITLTFAKKKKIQKIMYNNSTECQGHFVAHINCMLNSVGVLTHKGRKHKQAKV
ncbi:uncharacterized protein [Gossypium hirsutum]|uniref:Phorbol-ester/DAG-type domain-containing protein n=1 Tax=Gossypium hirsutum TaxID=3635 RepID=A0A1U8IAQ2_GOSHI|nr:uncharacterized protein LOC107894432 [Gossypium hirsutum]